MKDFAKRALAYYSHVFGRDKTDCPVVVFPDYRIAYIPVPKAACSSIRTALRHLSDASVNKLAEIPISKCADGMDASWFVFSVVRNPYPRLVSAYQNKVVERAEEVLPAFQRMGIKRHDDFEKLIKLTARWPKRVLDAHLMPQSLYLSRAPAFLRTYRLEDIDAGWNEICDEIEQRSGMRLPSLGHRNSTGAGEKWRRFYTDSLYRVTNGIYADDFTHLGYQMEAPTAAQPKLRSPLETGSSAD